MCKAECYSSKCWTIGQDIQQKCIWLFKTLYPSLVYTSYCNTQGIAGLDCWIAQSGLQSILLDWIVIGNPKSKSDFGFGLSIQFLHFNPNPKTNIFFIKKLKTHDQSCYNKKAKLFFYQHCLAFFKSWLIKICLLRIPCIKNIDEKDFKFLLFFIFYQVVGL